MMMPPSSTLTLGVKKEKQVFIVKSFQSRDPISAKLSPFFDLLP
jgi:hypothetical protein